MIAALAPDGATVEVAKERFAAEPSLDSFAPDGCSRASLRTGQSCPQTLRRSLASPQTRPLGELGSPVFSLTECVSSVEKR